MRTTLTLDEDLAVQLKQLSEARKQPFKQIVNEALRAGLAALVERPSPPGAYRIEPVSVGSVRLPSLDDIAEVLSIAEGEAHR